MVAARRIPLWSRSGLGLGPNQNSSLLSLCTRIRGRSGSHFRLTLSTLLPRTTRLRELPTHMRKPCGTYGDHVKYGFVLP